MKSVVDYVLSLIGQPQRAGTFHPVASTVVAALLLTAVYLVALPLYNHFFQPKFDPRGKHCYVTGGSQGLGKSLAVRLARRGAHVTIVARRQDVLDAAVEEIKAARQSPSQRIHAVPASVATYEGATGAVAKATALQGVSPEYVFCCAGMARPMTFLDQSIKNFEEVMQINYFGALYTIKAAVHKMVEENIHGRVIVVGSIAGFMGMFGYAEYSPTKHALRGLAECLRNELLMFGIKIHYYAPNTIYSPGFEIEQQTKPQITKDLEGTDSGMTPDQCADGLLRGIGRNEFLITTDIVGDVFRCSMSGLSPQNNIVVDGILAVAAWIILGPVRAYMDLVVRNEGRKLTRELLQKKEKKKS